MYNGSYCDQKSQLSEILTEPLNPRSSFIEECAKYDRHTYIYTYCMVPFFNLIIWWQQFCFQNIGETIIDILGKMNAKPWESTEYIKNTLWSEKK